ncbi:MAG TPA: sigma E factor regulator [Eubacteriaceae bacterium]|jgi:sigma-E factor negative regulatory protein RseC|nr:sigma E factor regulator [Eubacteriaceae bacterium]
MKEIGVVNTITGNKASVTIKRHAACGDCGACAVGKEKMTMETTAQNGIGAKAGDTVEVEMQFTNIMQASMIAYGLPLLMFVIGAVVGFYPINTLFGTPENPITAFATGTLLTAITYIAIKFADKSGRFSNGFEPIITNVINNGN